MFLNVSGFIILQKLAVRPKTLYPRVVVVIPLAKCFDRHWERILPVLIHLSGSWWALNSRYPSWGRRNEGGVEFPTNSINVSWLASLCECHCFTGAPFPPAKSMSSTVSWCKLRQYLGWRLKCVVDVVVVQFSLSRLRNGQSSYFEYEWCITQLQGGYFSSCFVCVFASWQDISSL